MPPEARLWFFKEDVRAALKIGFERQARNGGGRMARPAGTRAAATGAHAQASPLAALRGLGPATAAALAVVGIGTGSQSRDADPFEVYALLKRRDPRTSPNLPYALIGATEDRDWRELARRERSSILLRPEAMRLLD